MTASERSLLVFLIAGVSIALNLASGVPLLAQSAKPLTPCQATAADLPPSIDQWCAEKQYYDAQVELVTKARNNFNTSEPTVGAGTAAATIANRYITSLNLQLTELRAISKKIEDIIEVAEILPKLGEDTADASIELAQLRVDLAGMIADYEASKYTLANPEMAKPTPPPTPKPAPVTKPKPTTKPTTPTKPADTTKPPATTPTPPPTKPTDTTKPPTTTPTPPPTKPTDTTKPPATTPTPDTSKPETTPTPPQTRSAEDSESRTDKDSLNLPSLQNIAEYADDVAEHIDADSSDSNSSSSEGAEGIPIENVSGYSSIIDKTEAQQNQSGTSSNAGDSNATSVEDNKTAAKASKSKPPASAAKPGESGTGVITGLILDYDTSKPVPRAIVIARCGSNGDNVYTTRTDISGRYIFLSIPAGSCLIRAAKWLSPSEATDAQCELVRLIKVENGNTSYTIPADKQCPRLPRFKVTPQEREATDKLAPVYWAYQEDTINNLEVTANGRTIASDLPLHKRTDAIGEFARTIVGFQQSGANSADSVQRYFMDLWLSTPAPFLSGWQRAWKADPNFGTPLRFWGDIRITSTPQQIQSSLGDFVVGFAGQVSALKVNEVAQAAELNGGSELRLFHWGATKYNRLLSFDASARERFGVYFVLGGGFTTPIEPKSFTQVFINPIPGTEPTFDKEIASLGLTSAIAGKQFIAFVSQDRAKFLGQYYGGMRVKTFYYDRYTDEPLRRFPATLDVLIGQNTDVTGGIYRRPVVKLDGFYPLPYQAVKFVYLFGTAELVLGGPKAVNPILLQAGTNAPPIPDPSIFLMPPMRELNRDQYRIGAGIDFIQLIDSIKSANVNKPKTTKGS